MMFFADRPKAAREMARVLRPGGRAAIAVWDSVERNPAYAIMNALLAEKAGPAAAEAIRLPFCLGDPADVTAALSAAGFGDVSVATETATARFASARLMVEAELRGWLPLFDIQLDEARIADILGAADQAFAEFTDSEGAAAFPMSAHIASAIKP